jgi:hypothetical protein
MHLILFDNSRIHVDKAGIANKNFEKSKIALIEKRLCGKILKKLKIAQKNKLL